MSGNQGDEGDRIPDRIVVESASAGDSEQKANPFLSTGRLIEYDLRFIVSQLPDAMRAQVERDISAGTRVKLPAALLSRKLQKGDLSISFGTLKKMAPKHLFRDDTSLDHKRVDLDVEETQRQLNGEAPRSVDVPDLNIPKEENSAEKSCDEGSISMQAISLSDTGNESSPVSVNPPADGEAESMVFSLREISTVFTRQCLDQLQNLPDGLETELHIPAEVARAFYENADASASWRDLWAWLVPAPPMTDYEFAEKISLPMELFIPRFNEWKARNSADAGESDSISIDDLDLSMEIGNDASIAGAANDLPDLMSGNENAEESIDISIDAEADESVENELTIPLEDQSVEDVHADHSFVDESEAPESHTDVDEEITAGDAVEDMEDIFKEESGDGEDFNQSTAYDEEAAEDTIDDIFSPAQDYDDVADADQSGNTGAGEDASEVEEVSAESSEAAQNDTDFDPFPDSFEEESSASDEKGFSLLDPSPFDTESGNAVAGSDTGEAVAGTQSAAAESDDDFGAVAFDSPDSDAELDSISEDSCLLGVRLGGGGPEAPGESGSSLDMAESLTGMGLSAESEPGHEPGFVDNFGFDAERHDEEHDALSVEEQAGETTTSETDAGPACEDKPALTRTLIDFGDDELEGDSLLGDSDDEFSAYGASVEPSKPAGKISSAPEFPHDDEKSLAEEELASGFFTSDADILQPGQGESSSIESALQESGAAVDTASEELAASGTEGRSSRKALNSELLKGLASGSAAVSASGGLDSMTAQLSRLFLQPDKQFWATDEIIQKTAMLEGIAGVIVSFEDGMLVGAKVSDDRSDLSLIGEKVPEFFRQAASICGGEAEDLPDSVALQFGDDLVHIFHASGLYLMAFAEGADAPIRQLKFITSYLSRKLN